MTMRVKCGDCAYFSPNFKTSGTDGQCRRYPPAVRRTDLGTRAQWPLVFQDGWCGEHAVEVHDGPQ